MTAGWRFWYWWTWDENGKTYARRFDPLSVHDAKAAHESARKFGWVERGWSKATVSALYASDGQSTRELAPEASREDSPGNAVREPIPGRI